MSFVARQKGNLKKWLEKRGYLLERLYPAETNHGKAGDLRFGIAEYIIQSILKTQPDAVVVGIGAFDGKSNDFLFDYIREYPVKAVLVEPQPEAFRLLSQNYKGIDNVVLENAAMAWEDKVLPLYRIKTEYHGAFRLAPQLASFNRQHLVHALSEQNLKGLPADREQCLESIDVPSLSFESLLKKHNLTRLDILQIDTEGFDYEIVKMLDFSKIQPKVINFEIVHLSFEELNEAIDLLIRNGYQTLRYGINMVALRTDGSSVEEHFYEGSTYQTLES